MSTNPRLLADAARTPNGQKDWTQRAALGITSLQQRMAPFQGAQNWVAPTLLNSWAYYGAPYNPPGYYRDPFGRVWLRGLMNGGTLVSIAFVVPWTPKYTQLLSGSYMTSGGTVAVSGRVDVDTSGNVTLGTNDTAGAVSWFCLDGLSFLLS